MTSHAWFANYFYLFSAPCKVAAPNKEAAVSIIAAAQPITFSN